MAEKATGDEKLKGAVAYLLGPITGVALLLMEKQNKFIRFHAMQSTLLFGLFFLISVVLGIIPILGWLIALILSPILTIVAFALWLVLMWKAYSGEKYKLPYIGEIAEKQLEKMKP